MKPTVESVQGFSCSKWSNIPGKKEMRTVHQELTSPAGVSELSLIREPDVACPWSWNSVHCSLVVESHSFPVLGFPDVWLVGTDHWHQSMLFVFDVHEVHRFCYI